MVLYDTEVRIKEKELKPRIKLNHNIYNPLFIGRPLKVLRICSVEVFGGASLYTILMQSLTYCI